MRSIGKIRYWNEVRVNSNKMPGQMTGHLVQYPKLLKLYSEEADEQSPDDSQYIQQTDNYQILSAVSV